MSSPSLAQIRTAIKAKIDGVAGIGKMNDYERYSREASALLAQYVFDTGGGVMRLQGWFLAYRGTAERSPGNGRYEVTHTWEIRGFYALDDSAGSEKAFDALIELLRDAFRTDESLGGLISSTVLADGSNYGTAGLQVTEKNAAVFAGVLCHAMRGRLYTRYYL